MLYAPSTSASTSTATNVAATAVSQPDQLFLFDFGKRPAGTARATSKAPETAQSHPLSHASHKPHPPTSSASIKYSQNHKKIWSTSTREERERIKEFWLGLGKDERRNLVNIEKDTVLKKMKEQQKHSCSCAACNRKRRAIEEELDVLYDAYYEELQQYADRQQDHLKSGGTIPPPPGPGPFPGSVELDQSGTVVGLPYSIPIHHPPDDGDEEAAVEEGEEGEMDSVRKEVNEQAGLFNMDSSFTVTGSTSILIVADDLMQNDGQKFLEMMEQLTECRMQCEEAAADVEEDEVGDDKEVMSKEQKMEEGKRLFTIFASRIFEQRVLQTYREKIAQERQQQLLRELEDEDKLSKKREVKKQTQNQKKKDKKKQQKLAKEEERAAKAKAAEEAVMMAKQQAREEEMRKTREEEKAKREVARKAADEEMRMKKEEERIKHEAARKTADEEKQCKEEERIRSMSPGDLSMYITRDGEFPVAAGGCADIYKGTLCVHEVAIKVAIKVIKVYSAEDSHHKKKKRLRREVKVWMKLNHINVLSLFGTTSGFGPFPAMVCPWLENGTLTSYLERCGADLEILRILTLIHDVASGLQHLHSQSTVHGDLSGSNVLIHANGRACIADFGLSTVLDELGGSTFATSSTGKPRGTLRWAAPELLDLLDHEDTKTQHTRPTIQSDIYSFGSIMLQILSGKVPYHYYSRDVQIVNAISKGKTPERPPDPHVTEDRWEFIQRCWSPFRIVVQRPSSDEIVAFSRDDLVGNSPQVD